EDHPLTGAVELIRKLQSEQRRFACLSNSASSPLRVMNRLHAMGVDIDPDHIYTAAAAACDYVLQNFPTSAPKQFKPRVFNLSTEGVHDMLDGLVEWVNTGGEPCDAVIAGTMTNVYATEDRQRVAL